MNQQKNHPEIYRSMVYLIEEENCMRRNGTKLGRNLQEVCELFAYSLITLNGSIRFDSCWGTKYSNSGRQQKYSLLINRVNSFIRLERKCFIKIVAIDYSTDVRCFFCYTLTLWIISVYIYPLYLLNNVRTIWKRNIFKLYWDYIVIDLCFVKMYMQ